MDLPAQRPSLFCESCLDLELKPQKHEDPEIRIREVKYECDSCDYYLVGLGE